jgi:hypothetical protein
MTKIRIGLPNLAAIGIIAVAILSYAAVVQEKKIPSAYEQLPTDRLIRQLSLLGMTELLRAIEDDIPADDKSFRALALRGRVRMGLANAMAKPEDQNAKMDEAIAILRAAVKKGQQENSANAGEQLELYRVMLELATAAGRYRIENPHILRLRMLLGNDADRKIILQSTKEAVEIIDILEDKISHALTGLRSNMGDYMRYGPAMEDLQREMRYNSGWIRLHRAMALPAGSERAELCRNVIADMKEFIGDPDSGVVGWAMYAIGAAHRMLAGCAREQADVILKDPKRARAEADARIEEASREHAEADDVLKKVAENPAEDKELRQRAWFERVWNRIDEGADAKIDLALADFEKGSLAIWGEEKRVIVDLRLVLLRSYRVELSAVKETNADKRKALFAQAQAELLKFVEQYADRPDLIRAFLEMVNTKFAGDEDLANASAIVCMARAYAKLGSDKPQDKAEGEKLLLVVLNHKDLDNPKIARAIEPGVLYELAFIMNQRKLNVEASKYFVRLARTYPKHDLAEKAAMFAVRSLYGVFAERQEKREEIPPSLRLEYVRALETFLGNWSTSKDAVKWNFDLAAQCIKLAEQSEAPAVKFYWQVRAIAADEKIPLAMLEYMEAQHSALEMRYQIVLNRDELAETLGGGPERLKQALGPLAETLVELDTVVLPPAASATSAPAEDAEVKVSAEARDKKIAETLKLLDDSLKTYSDPAALIEKLKKYSVDALAESRKAAEKAASAGPEDKALLQANADGLREWSAQAEYQAAVIKYEQLPKMLPKDNAEGRQKIEHEALEDLRVLIARLSAQGTSNGVSAREHSPVLPMAHEFEIRKLIELGRTDEAIAKIQDFKKSFPDQAKQLIQLLVQQIQEQIIRLEKRLKSAVTQAQADEIRQGLDRYQTAYVNFAKDLYDPVAGKPLKLPELEAVLRDLRAMEQKRDFDGLLAKAQELPALAAENDVKLEDLKGKDKDKLDSWIAGAKAPGADRNAVLPMLAAATMNMVLNIRNVVMERYGLVQMYADSLLNRGKAEQLAKHDDVSKAAYKEALDLFKKCFDLDDACRKGEAEWLARKYSPFIQDVRDNAKGTGAVSRMVEAFRKELKDTGQSQAMTADMSSMEYAVKYLGGAANQEQWQERLPRAVEMLVRGWENLLRTLQNQTTIDHVNIIGMARANYGLGNYGEAMALYRRYTEGIPRDRFPKIYWHAELERCQCNLDGYLANAEAMKNLVIQINSLRIKDKEMGGLAREFEQIKAKAAEKAAQAGLKGK